MRISTQLQDLSILSTKKPKTMLRIALNPNPGHKVGWALEGEEIKKISTASTAWNPFHKLASLSLELLPGKLAEAKHLFVGEITNVYLDRGEQPLTEQSHPSKGTWNSCTDNELTQKSQHVGGTWHHRASLGDCGAVNASWAPGAELVSFSERQRSDSSSRVKAYVPSLRNATEHCCISVQRQAISQHSTVCLK